LSLLVGSDFALLACSCRAFVCGWVAQWLIMFYHVMCRVTNHRVTNHVIQAELYRLCVCMCVLCPFCYKQFIIRFRWFLIVIVCVFFLQIFLFCKIGKFLLLYHTNVLL
jgi:hypothetical protein